MKQLLPLLLCLPLAARANISVLQSNATQNAGAGTTQAVTLSSTVAGDAINCYVVTEAYGTTLSLSDSHNTYTASAQSPLTNGSYYIWNFVAVNINGGSLTITATASQGNVSTPMMNYCEEIGQAKASPLDGQNGATQGTAGTPISSGNATNSNQPALISGFDAFGNTVSVGAAFTLTDFGGNHGISNYWVSEHERITSTGSQAATFTQVSSYFVATAMITIFDEATVVVSGNAGMFLAQ